MANVPSQTHLIWIDLEMTGLDPDRDQILQIATLITNEQLEVLAEGPDLAITTPASVLAAMDEWNTRTHSESGLVERCLNSGVSLAEAEQRTLHFVRQWVEAGKSPMCGNSICQDRRFLVRGMPELAAHFHYRNLDVSTLKELALRWAPELASAFKKDSTHQAMDDIKDSIAELQWYRRHMGLLSGQS